ncbi:MAG: hypothetical protein FD162_2201 [Rhodobacteraceae bacterium]|uniref:hypothetical protein n=1 Tax=Cypionkella sp. TaxID=2811411 RepID=UPI001322B770|nr:hypothetical protein [Cypionkella sp.]KAF0172611.1 MAG: hypothetical protein FD162_2201 [Paracoccaceae bacterium]MDO8325942.1 hypothetical protein [Cypionkella sp.]
MSLTYMRSAAQVQLAIGGNDLVGSIAAQVPCRLCWQGRGALLSGEGNDRQSDAPFFSQSTLPANSGLRNGGAGNDSLIATSDGFTEAFVFASNLSV